MTHTANRGYQRELERQRQRKEQLRADCELSLKGIDRIFFEAGCGHGHWLTSFAEANPEQVCVGVDLISLRIRKACDKRDKRSLSNLHFFKADLNEFLDVLPKNIRFDQTMMLFPDPWPKARHHRRRMVQEAFLNAIADRTDAGGYFFFRTDDSPYFKWTMELIDLNPHWEIDGPQSWPYETETYFQSLMEAYRSVTAVRQ
ncbi:MAG: tRNA (guanosine(46)-N7)-methyltransferase TrmB [Verrucomicrobiota bacterium]